MEILDEIYSKIRKPRVNDTAVDTVSTVIPFLLTRTYKRARGPTHTHTHTHTHTYKCGYKHS